MGGAAGEAQQELREQFALCRDAPIRVPEAACQQVKALRAVVNLARHPALQCIGKTGHLAQQV